MTTATILAVVGAVFLVGAVVLAPTDAPTRRLVRIIRAWRHSPHNTAQK